MEFLRFGSSIPGSYFGCCAVCIIQNFSKDPDEKASIQLVDGDGGYPLIRNGEEIFAGPTYKDIFLQRLRVGTFSDRDMPSHVFLAVLTDLQIKTRNGKKWLALLKETGFEFVRTTDNSVYTGAGLGGTRSPHKNYLFGLFRNIGEGKLDNPFEPPEAWTSLPSVVEEPLSRLSADEQTDVASAQRAVHTEIWNAIGKPKFLTRAELTAMGVPITLAGKRSMFPQQLEDTRLLQERQLEAEGYKVPKDVEDDPWGDDDFEEEDLDFGDFE